MNYTNSELNEQVEIFYQRLTQNKTPTREPWAILTGGQPGSGKSSIEKRVNYISSNFVFLNTDEFRDSHPRYEDIKKEYGSDHPKHTAQWAGAITEALIERLAKEKYNLLIEGTLRTTEVPEQTAHRLRTNGYKVDLYVMAVKPEVSFTGTITRFFQGLQNDNNGRAVDKKHHDLVVSRLQENLIYLAKKKRFDEIVVCNRAGELTRSQNNPDEITAAINHEWSRPLTEKEAQDLCRQQAFVYQMLKAEQQKEVSKINEAIITEMRSFLEKQRGQHASIQINKPQGRGLER